jgi:nucleotide-binding universal stress UspA family protein
MQSTNGSEAKFRKILVGYDGSEESERALNLSLALADAAQGRVMLLTVAQPPEPATLVEAEKVMEDAREHFELRLKRIANAARENGIDVETAIIVGHPAEEIINRAEQEQVDLIVVGRRGSSLFETLLGSVSERVLWHAPCPVLIAR